MTRDSNRTRRDLLTAASTGGALAALGALGMGEARAVVRSQKPLRAAFTNGGLQSSWCAQGKAAAEYWGNLFNVEVTWFDGESDATKQRAAVERMATQGQGLVEVGDQEGRLRSARGHARRRAPDGCRAHVQPCPLTSGQAHREAQQSARPAAEVQQPPRTVEMPLGELHVHGQQGAVGQLGVVAARQLLVVYVGPEAARDAGGKFPIGKGARSHRQITLLRQPFHLFVVPRASDGGPAALLYWGGWYLNCTPLLGWAVRPFGIAWVC